VTTPRARQAQRALRSPPWLLLTITGLVVVALLLPPVEMGRSVHRYLFLVDISQSMNVRDQAGTEGRVSRLQGARETIQRFLERATCGSEAGLALFSGHRALLLIWPIEICANYDELIRLASRIDWSMAWKASSEVTKGVDSALRMLARYDDAIRLVVFTDGHEAPPVNPKYPPLTRAEPGTIAGVIAGVGGDEPVQIPKLDQNGRFYGYWRPDEVMQVDRFSLGRSGSRSGEVMVGVDSGDLAARIAKGREHLSSLKEAWLTEMGERTGLKYHRVRTPEETAESLVSSDLAVRKAVATDLHWVFALTAAVLLVFHLVRKLD
jgi:mxaL protein